MDFVFYITLRAGSPRKNLPFKVGEISKESQMGIRPILYSPISIYGNIVLGRHYWPCSVWNTISNRMVALSYLLYYPKCDIKMVSQGRSVRYDSGQAHNRTLFEYGINVFDHGDD